jgi:hypothetical protein
MNINEIVQDTGEEEQEIQPEANPEAELEQESFKESNALEAALNLEEVAKKETEPEIPKPIEKPNEQPLMEVKKDIQPVVEEKKPEESGKIEEPQPVPKEVPAVSQIIEPSSSPLADIDTDIDEVTQTLIAKISSFKSIKDSIGSTSDFKDCLDYCCGKTSMPISKPKSYDIGIGIGVGVGGKGLDYKSGLKSSGEDILAKYRAGHAFHTPDIPKPQEEEDLERPSDLNDKEIDNAVVNPAFWPTEEPAPSESLRKKAEIVKPKKYVPDVPKVPPYNYSGSRYPYKGH